MGDATGPGREGTPVGAVRAATRALGRLGRQHRRGDFQSNYVTPLGIRIIASMFWHLALGRRG